LQKTTFFWLAEKQKTQNKQPLGKVVAIFASEWPHVEKIRQRLAVSDFTLQSTCGICHNRPLRRQIHLPRLTKTLYVMKKTINGLLMLSALIFWAAPTQAQEPPVNQEAPINQEPPIIKDVTTPIVEPLNLSGPRIGISFADGYNVHPLFEVFAGEEEAPSPLTTVFGWQFEHRYFTAPDGSAGLIEVIPMVAGFEQGRFIPLMNFLVGYRSASGVEFGIGPQINPVGSGVVIALGNNYTNGYVNFPVNLAVVTGKDTFRVALTCGFNVRNKKSNAFSIF
jgi:hypothetical protein